jgi:arsenite methyltransferase
MTTTNAAPDVTEAIRSQYGAVAASGLTGDSAGVRAVAEAFGYSADELASIPAAANMGLSCGNPTASASLRPGEVVVDLGCGGGLDVFLAAAKVGPTGKAIGIDMTPEMVDRARRNAQKGADGKPVGNVEFHLGTIDDLPLPDASVDVVISNCVINLAPDKQAVFRDVARVLKPGGRLAVSDIALKKPLPPELGSDLSAYVGCVAGAIQIEEYRAGLLAAGFGHVQVVDSGADLNAYAHVEGQSACCAPPRETEKATLPIASSGGCCGGGGGGKEPAGTAVHDGLADLFRKYDVNEYAASVKVYAVKPK